MMKTLFWRAIAAIGLTAASLCVAHAQLHVEIAGVGANQIPIAIAAFADESIAPQQLTAIIKPDLSGSGLLNIIETGNTMPETSAINFGEWKSRGADALVVRSVQRLGDGRLDVPHTL